MTLAHYCCLCERPIGQQSAQDMPLGARAHVRCYQERYAPVQREVQAVMVLEEAGQQQEGVA